MIIVRLTGGLGNQLFQYALGKHLAIKHNAPLKLDITSFETYKLHRYSLNYFQITENLASPRDLRRFFWINNRVLLRLHGLLKFNSSYIQEPHFHFAPSIIESSDGVYLAGYWQSEKYFRDIAPIIRREFSLKPEFAAALDPKLKASITGSEAVSLHVRRADYVTDKSANRLYGVCTAAYYAAAVAYLAAHVPHARLFVFSDDIAWAKDNLRFDVPMEFVDHGADKNYEDLTLMGMCRHNIIANSTFSWWGAWLNPNPDKIVVAPANWFQPGTLQGQDIIPDTWVRINN